MIKDWRGNEIEVGCTVVYPVTQSSSVKMVEAVVDQITEEENPYSWSGTKKMRTVLQVKRMAEDSKMWGPIGKLVKISRIDRVTVIPPSPSPFANRAITGGW